jgi:lipoprotein-releasing system permease protein
MNTYRYIAGKIRQGFGTDASSDRMGSVSTTIGMVSVALSIFVIIVAVCVLLGFRKEIRDKTSAFMGTMALVAPGQTPMNEKFPFSDNISFLDRLDSVQGVEGHFRVAYSSGLIKTPDNIYGAHFKGVDSLYNFSFFKDNISSGEIPKFGGRISPDVLMAARLAHRMGYGVGDEITAYFIGEEVKVRKFKIAGLFETQLENLDNTMILCDIRQVQRINGWEKDEISTIEIMLSGNADIDRKNYEITDLIYEESTDDDPPLFATSVKQIFPNLFDWLNLLDTNVLAILILMITVAGFNMISSLLIILFRNISTIGLLKAMGMTSRGVAKVFRHVALDIVARGLAAGAALAIILCAVQKHFKILTLDPDNYFVKYVPIEFNFIYIAAVVLLSLAAIMVILSLTSGFISRVSPDKTMRAA